LKHLVSIDESADLGEALDALALCGNVTTPAERTPRTVLVECDDPSGIMAVAEVCGCCDADKPISPSLIEILTPANWAVGAVTTGGDDQIAHITPDPIRLCDVPTNTALVANSVLVYNPSGGFGDHGTGTAALLRAVDPLAEIRVFECFLSNGTGTALSVFMGMSACADDIEDNPPVRAAVVSMSFSDGSPTNPFAAVQARLAALGAIQVAASGNDGVNLVQFPRHPASAADVVVGAMDANRVRANFSNEPCTLHAGGVQQEFLLADGSTTLGDGTSIAAPLVAAAINNAYTYGHDLAWLLTQSITGVLMNLPPGGSDAILHFPTTEIFNPTPGTPPPPTRIGTDIMQLLHVGGAQTIPNAVTTDVIWETAPGAFQTELTIDAGITSARINASILTKSLPATAKIWLYGMKNGVIVTGGRVDRSGSGGVEAYLQINTLAFDVVPGDLVKCAVWHDGGTGVSINERGDAQLGLEVEQTA
jgi:hypothetical protein